MQPSSEDLARLADDSYERNGFKPPEEYAVFKVIESPTGYRGVIYQHKFTHDLVVAHTGTEFDVDKGRDVFLTDAQMALLKVNQQLDDARATVELAMEYAKRDGAQVTVTGHSLGGFLTQATCHEYGLRGETFNAYGAAGLYGVPEGGSQVINHVRATDMVTAVNGHFGEVKVYATQRDEDVLLSGNRAADPSDRYRLPAEVLKLPPSITHGIIQFHGGPRDIEKLEIYGPNSVISNKNQETYQQHKMEFDAYRNDIRQTAQGLTLLVRNTGIGATYSTGIGAQYAGHKLRRAAIGDEVREDIRELRLEARREIEERNRNFVPPAEPLIFREGTRDPVLHLKEQIDDRMRQWDDDRCRPPGGTRPEPAPHGDASPISLRDDPLDYINRMVAAYDADDPHTFRQMTRGAADDPFAQQMQTQAAAQVDREELQARLMAEQQQQNQQQHEMQHVLVRGA